MSLVTKARKVDGVWVKYTKLQQNCDTGGVSEEKTEWGGLVHTISKGGCVTNCTVSGSVHDAGSFGGLFYEGEDVTVKNCTVDLQVDGGDTFAGIAMNLKGTASSISNVSVKGDVSAGVAAGVAAGMDGGSINKVLVTGNYEASGGAAAGMVLNMDGGSISDCRVSAVLSGTAGAYGIAAKMKPGAQINRSYSACRLSASATDAWVCGIAKGIDGMAEGVSGCVVAGSHFSGAHAARVCTFPPKDCAAYEGMTCDGSFTDSGEALKPASKFHEKALYEQMGWDFGEIWDMDPEAPFPVLKGSSIKQYYDFPFPYPMPPESGKFVYETGKVIAILGKRGIQIGDKMTWSLSPHDVTGRGEADGELQLKQDDFYLQIASLPVPGKYDLVLYSVLEGHKYGILVLLEVQDAQK